MNRENVSIIIAATMPLTAPMAASFMSMCVDDSGTVGPVGSIFDTSSGAARHVAPLPTGIDCK